MTKATTDEMSIGETAVRGGVTTSTLRYYEEIGLVRPRRRVSGQRRYGADALARLEMIRSAKEVGFTLPETKRLLAGIDAGERGTERLRKLAQKKLPEVEEALRRAQLMVRLLTAAQRCRCPSLERCFELVSSASSAPTGGARRRASGGHSDRC